MFHKIAEFILFNFPGMYYLRIFREEASGNTKFVAAIEAPYAPEHPATFISKAATGKEYVVPPIEGLWWAEDPTDFASNRRESWKWTLKTFFPEWVTEEHVHAATSKALAKWIQLAQQVQILELTEGSAHQALHIGSFVVEGPIHEQLHNTVMPAINVTFTGFQHAMYLSDFRKTAPSKQRTILRQPVKQLNQH